MSSEIALDAGYFNELYENMLQWYVAALVISGVAAQRALLDHIFVNYSSDVRPVKLPASSTNVTVGFGLVIMENHEEKRQVFITHGVLEISWKDETLAWPRLDFDVSRVTVPASKLWVPDLVFTNAINNVGKLPTDGVNAVLQYTGEITLNIGGRRETYCRVDVSKFPFDTQVCTIRVRQWASVNSEVAIVTESPYLDLSQYQGNNGEYTIVSTAVETSMSRDQTEVMFSVTFTRRSTYYVQLCVLPVFLLSLLNLATFLVPAESGEKMTLAVSVFLSYAVFLTIIYGFLPELSDSISLYAVYLSVMLSLKVLTLLFTVWVLNVHYNRSDWPTPPWLRRLVVHFRFYTGVVYPISDTDMKLGRCPDVKWHEAAHVLDRALFVVFAIVTVIVTTLFFCYLNTR